jgi:hypothetical protein
MKTTTMTNYFVMATLFALGACGDNLKAPDARTHDSGGSNAHPVPALGTQMDRLGRPAINTALNHGFDKTTAAGTAKDAYNADGSPGGWGAANIAAFKTSLGIIDALDGTCGNQALYNGVPSGGGAATADSYTTLATVLANDQLFVDTTLNACEIPTSHANYLAVELNYILPTVVPLITCGGRAPTNDVIDATYTAAAVGITGFSMTDFTAAVKDNVGPHADVSNDTFPFLGAPH